MAKPPEPLADMLPLAGLVVDAIVKEVVSTGPATARPAGVDEHAKDVGTVAPEQVIVLEVKRVLKGAHSGPTIEVQKPLAPYSVKVGTAGAWLLDTNGAKPVVMGRYGPDSWHITRVEAALK